MFESTDFKPPRSQSIVLPIFVGALLVALSLFFSWSLQEGIHTNQRHLVHIQAEKYAEAIDTDMHSRIATLNRLVGRWEQRGGYTQQEFELDAGSYLTDLPGFQSIEWVDKESIVRWIVPLAGNEQALGLDLGKEETRRIALESARIRRTPTVSRPVDLVQGGRGFLIYFPIYPHNTYQGCLRAVFKVEDWINHAVHYSSKTNTEDQFAIRISTSGDVIYENESSAVVQPAFAASSTIQVLGRLFTLTCTPTEHFLKEHESRLPVVASVVGSLVAFLGAFMVRFFQTASNQVWMAHSVRMALHTQIKQRKKNAALLEETSTHLSLATKAGNIGVWAWDIQRGNLIWDERMFELYGLSPDLPPRYETWIATLHPEDIERVESQLLAAAEGKGPFETEYRILLPGGDIRHIHAAARLARNAAGDPVRMTGVNWDITDRTRIERQLQTQAEMQAILMSITTKYLNAPLATVEDEISTALEEIGRYVEADKVSVYEYDFNAGTASNKYEWCSPGIPTGHDRMQNIPLADYMSWVEEHKKRKSVIIPDVSRLPQSPLKALLTSLHIQTFLSVPMLQDGKVVGFVSFNWSRTLHRHSETELNILQVFAQILVNIRLRNAAENMLVESSHRLQLALQGTQAGLWDWQVQSGQLIVNERWAEIIGCTLQELEPVTIQTWLDVCHPDDLETSTRLLQDHFTGKTDRYVMEARMRHKNGEWVWVFDSGQIVEWDAHHQPVRMVGTHLDITDRRKAEEQIRHMATHDALTNLPTLRLAKDRILMAMANARRKSLHTAVLFVDLDGFKQVNDTLGHDAGDMVLKTVSQRFLKSTREIDTVCRIGGDEFLIVLMELQGPDDAAKVATKILDALKRPCVYNDEQIFIGASIGVALYSSPPSQEQVEALIRRADAAMYTAKRGGKNRYVFAEDETTQEPVATDEHRDLPT